jgi:predicted Zn-dependent protease
MKSCHALAALVLLTAASAAPAADYTHKPSGLRFTLPKGWTCTEKDGKLVITNPDQSLAVVGGVVPAEAAKAVLDDIQKFVAKLDGLTDVKVTDGPKREKVNGLEQAWYEGTATIKGADGKADKVEWDMTVVTGGKGVLFLVGTGKLDKNEKVYEKFFESIRKTKADDE